VARGKALAALVKNVQDVEKVRRGTRSIYKYLDKQTDGADSRHGKHLCNGFPLQAGKVKRGKNHEHKGNHLGRVTWLTDRPHQDVEPPCVNRLDNLRRGDIYRKVGIDADLEGKRNQSERREYRVSANMPVPRLLPSAGLVPKYS
jgi:hypothetical protein